MLAQSPVTSPHSIESVLLLSIVSASVSFTVTEMKIFRTLRESVAEKSRLMGELVSCCYCFGHWVSFALVAIYRPRLFESWLLLDYFLTALVIAWIAAVLSLLMCRLMDLVGK